MGHMGAGFKCGLGGATLMAVVLGSGPREVMAQARCPDARYLPQLSIDDVQDSPLFVVDRWQVHLQGVPLSDDQVAALARDDRALDITRADLRTRGTWVYVGMLTAAVGTVISSVGWVLFGQDKLPTPLTLTMGLGGLVMGGGGVLLVTDAVQTPLEPHLAPTPRHRLSRAELRRLVAIVNQRFYHEICQALEPGPLELTWPGQAPPVSRSAPELGSAPVPESPSEPATKQPVLPPGDVDSEVPADSPSP